MHPVATYLHEFCATRASGRATDELSYYGALQSLLNAAGDRLDPSVYCVMNPRGETGSFFSKRRAGGASGGFRGA